MTVIADLTTATSAPFRPTALPAASGVSFEAFHDLAAVEPLWRTMEAEGVGSPYQRFDWVRAYIEALAAHETFEPRIVLLRDAADRPLLLLPLAVRRRYGFLIASLIGGKQANYHLPLMGLHASTPFCGLPRIRARRRRSAARD
jgi:CelD/BcsL family acetyltransferase involved in cellulose biosynthesis